MTWMQQSFHLNFSELQKRGRGMLILKCHSGESILIDKQIEVIVLECSGGTARIGIKAPEEIHIIRKELHDRKLSHEQGTT